MNENSRKHAEAMRRDTVNHPVTGAVIEQLEIGRTAFYRYFPPERIRQLRDEHAGGARP